MCWQGMLPMCYTAVQSLVVGVGAGGAENHILENQIEESEQDLIMLYEPKSMTWDNRDY